MKDNVDKHLQALKDVARKEDEKGTYITVRKKRKRK